MAESRELVNPDFIEIKPWQDGVPAGGVITTRDIPEGKLEMHCELPTPGLDKTIGISSPRQIFAYVISNPELNINTMLKHLKIEIVSGGKVHKGIPEIVYEKDENGLEIRKIKYGQWTTKDGKKQPSPLILDRLHADQLTFKRTRTDKFTIAA